MPGTSHRQLASVFAALLALAACSQAPVLEVPQVPVSASYKEAGDRALAEAGEHRLPDDWWTLYRDEDLDALEKQLIANSPDLAAALARYKQANASYQAIRSNLFPSLSTALNAQRDRQSESKPLRVLGPNSPNEYSSVTLGFGLGYEFDLWGRVSNEVAAGRALDAAARADLASARLSLQALLAETYFILRGLDGQVQLLTETEEAYLRALELVKSRHTGGIASGLDVSRAEAQLEATRSLLEQTIGQRAVVEHAIAAQVGVAAPDFSLAPRTNVIVLPAIPVDVPSTLLQRRPDIMAAERRVEAANASVGVAKAAYFPQLRLDATYGYQSTEFANLVTASNVFWAVGPTLFLELFDGGRRKAEVARAEAVLDEAGANYRSVVLGAFQEVEDSLALLDKYRQAAASEAAAVAATQRSVDLSTIRYRAGAASYLEVAVSQASALQTRREAQDLDTRQLRASVQLIRAMGGGWTAPTGAPGSAAATSR
ncbi:MAG: efflux transporter outer membrane subunit [Gammaproteobacteria bacterium]|nr:efflux transporter outer membrane subunit [Gammaproteobacteria bacterium]